MSDIIQLLPDHVANQIAAGEVVQRPSSVVKELIENAVDAGATSIQLIVKDAGRSLIQVIDNGSGMSITDVRMAFERHATSKIKTTEDIFSITTKGFRGEALASIAAIAQVEIKTKLNSEDLGTHLVIEGGTLRDQAPTVTPTGTSIAVKNLFFNVPARRNFLKSNQVEFRHIQDEFQRVALAHENISFYLHHNETELFHLKSGNLKQRILQIFGRKLDAQLISVSEDTEIVKLHGFVGKPESAKKARGEQFFFVNQRFIRSNYLHKAILEAFENLLPNAYHPTYYLYLDLAPSKIDINIHPTKTEIKFEDEYAIFAVLRAAVKHALGQFNITPSLDFEQNPNWAFLSVANKNTKIKRPEIKVDRNYNPFTQDFEKTSSADIYNTQQVYKESYELEKENTPTAALFEQDQPQRETHIIQWQNKYLVVNLQNDLLIVDQHRAHQKILYEQFLINSKGNTLSQQLLFPIELELSPDDIQKIIQVEKQLITFGFDINSDEEHIYVNAIPMEIQQSDVPSVFSDFLAKLEYSENIDFETDFAKIMAKNAAIKKGVTLKQEQIQSTIVQLLQLEDPHFSPFGKPVFVQLNTEEIDKKLH